MSTVYLRKGPKMNRKYRIERDDQGNNWLVVTTAQDGIVDVLAEFTSRAQALAECKQFNHDYENARYEEARYQAMYDHACGYYD